MSTNLIDEKPKKLKRRPDKEQLKRLRREVSTLFKALQYYAEPSTYFATRVIVDPPAGDFANDFGKIKPEHAEMCGWEAYRGANDAYYGKTARKAVAKVVEGWNKSVEEWYEP